MKTDPEAEPCRDFNRLALRFLETNEANDISDVLGLMLEVYLQHAPVDKTDLVNATSLIYRLNKFFFNLEALKGKADGHPVLIVDEGRQQCTHN
jgi:hypothetical protein